MKRSSPNGRPAEKQWFRHKSQGHLGFLTVEDGAQYIEVDKGHEVILKPYSPADWIPEDDLRLMTEMQIAQICFAADSELNKVLRWEPQAIADTWLNMKPEHKRKWAQLGPEGDVRRRLFNAIQGALLHLTRE